MEMDGFAWLDSAGKNEPHHQPQTPPDPEPSSPTVPPPAKKKPSRIPAIIVTIFLFLVLIVSIAATLPLNYSHPTHHLTHHNPEPDITLLSGAMDLKGPIDGFSVDNGLSYFYDIEQLLLTTSTGTFTYTDATLMIQGGHMAWWIDTILERAISSGFLMIESSWEDESWTKITLFTDFELELMGHASLLTTQNSTVTINNQTYTGDIIAQLTGEFTSKHSGDTMSLGVSTSPFTITVEPSSATLLFEDLLNNVTNEENEKNITVPHLPVDANGIALMTGVNTTVHGKVLNYSHFCYSRGTFTVTVEEGITIEGQSHFILTDKGAYHDEPTYTYLPFIPRQIIGFWPIAIGIWAITRFFTPRKKKSVRPWENNESKSLKYWVTVFHLILLLISLYLWDHEIQDLFGRSILSMIFSMSETIFTPSLNNPLLLMAIFEFIPWFIGIVLIGLPLSISINSLLQVWSLSPKGKGIGKGIGDVATWVIGKVYIIFFLNIALYPILTALINHLFGSS